MPRTEEEKEIGGVDPRIQLAAKAAFGPTRREFRPIYRTTETTTVSEKTTTTCTHSRRKRVAQDESKNEDEDSTDKTTVVLNKEIKKVRLTDATDKNLVGEYD